MMIDQVFAFFTAVMTAGTPAATPSKAGPLRAQTAAPVAKPVATATTTPVPVAAATNLQADQVIDKVQVFYAGIKQVTAKFRQSVTNATFGQAKDNDGKMWIAKPGKMRWDYYSKKKTKVTTKKSFISNGTNLYVVEHDNKQVMKKNLQVDLMPVAVSFLYGKGDLRTDFSGEIDTSKKYGATNEIVLKLTPKKPSAQYKHLMLVVSPDNFRVTQSIIIDSSNNINHFRFFEPDFETAQNAAWCEFDPKSVKSYRVVDADQPEGKDGKAPAAPGAVPAAPAPAAPAAAPAKPATK
jgi:outer membrane lipoprotein-sorting protein